MTGAAGSGKTTWTIEQVRDSPRLLVWDSGYDFAPALRLTPVRRLCDLGDLVLEDLRSSGSSGMSSHASRAPQRIAYTGPITREHFITFCRIAYVWMRAHERSALVVDELADVTSSGKATPGWGDIVRKHRKFTRGRVFALTQRPAESDKTIIGNATILHCGRMNFAEDEVYISKCLKVPLEDIQALPDFHYLERNMRTRALSRGVVAITR